MGAVTDLLIGWPCAAILAEGCCFAYALEQTIKIIMQEIATGDGVCACLYTTPGDDMCFLGKFSALHREGEKNNYCAVLHKG